MSTDQFIWFVEHVIEYTCVSFASWENFTSALKKIPRTFADLESGMAWPYLIASLLIAYGLFVLSRRRRTDTFQSFYKFLFPSHVYQHPSAVLDYKFYAVSLVLDALVIGPIILGIAVVGYKMTMAFSTWLLWLPPATMPQSYLIGAVFGLFLLSDFMFYVSHYLFHKIPMLWAFHVVHHSAEVLTPITARRFHPMEILVGAVMQAPVAGATSFLYQALSAHDRQITLIFGVSIFVFVFALSGRHLRHSHIWLSYGPVVSWLLISPAQHQIHHSVDPRHRDKNFGERFALWDALFGTLYVPAKREILQVGLPDADYREFVAVRQLYLAPFRNAFRECIRSVQKHLSVGLFLERVR